MPKKDFSVDGHNFSLETDASGKFVSLKHNGKDATTTKLKSLKILDDGGQFKDYKPATIPAIFLTESNPQSCIWVCLADGWHQYCW